MRNMRPLLDWSLTGVLLFLQSAINGAAEGVNNTVSSIPLVQTFEVHCIATSHLSA